ncbi:MAG: PSD1 and planctomycete cytochrome C domain-containing protein [Akkermansiaceae bacterium]
MYISRKRVAILTIGIISVALVACEKKQSAISVDSQADKTSQEVVEKKKNLTLISADEPVSFNEHVQPILSEYCYHCHGPDSGSRQPEKNPLRLDIEADAFLPRENGKPVIIKANPDESYLIELIESTDKELMMPPHPETNPHGKLMKPGEIALLRRWVKEGAEFEDHWAYISPKKHELPEVKNEDWAKENPIDRFVAAEFEQAGLEPSPEEKPARLYRRLFFDLTGLPPTNDELQKLLDDEREFNVIYRETVDKLLNTDAYAEHWTRHWLDVARYADTHGIHIDNYRAIWPYRDWVINSFRSNMPFDQFTREQMAGDMMPNATVDQIVATGFNRCLPTTGEGGAIADEYNAIYAQDRTDTTAAAWLGLTTGCAACHDHKFDAISTKENYQLTAFFRNTPMSALDGNNANHPPNIRLFSNPEDEKDHAKLTKSVAKLQKQYDQLIKANDKAFKEWKVKLAQDTDEKNKKLQQLAAKEKPSRRDLRTLKNEFFRVVFPASKKLHGELNTEKEKLNPIEKRSPITLVMKENADKTPFANILIRGNYSDKGDKVTPDTPASLPPMGDLPKNRLGLAQWLTQPENPLPARVTVNRYWYYLFGRGIVETTGDFGVMGSRPTHPKLLDWLAVDFVENNWDLHHLLRTIVTSSTYRQSSVISAKQLELDPENILLARGPRYRLDAEQIRDLALKASGLLNKKIGGPSVKPYQPDGIWSAVAMPQSNTKNYQRDSGEKLYRRSLYTFWKRTAPHPSMEILNAPVREISCVRRELTNTPLQAFVIMNDPQFVEASRRLAERALKEAKTTENRINLIASALLARPMSNDELDVVKLTLGRAKEKFTATPEDAQKLINVGESKPDANLPAPELAAWTIIANQILNLDETLKK